MRLILSNCDSAMRPPNVMSFLKLASCPLLIWKELWLARRPSYSGIVDLEKVLSSMPSSNQLKRGPIRTLKLAHHLSTSSLYLLSIQPISYNKYRRMMRRFLLLKDLRLSVSFAQQYWLHGRCKNSISGPMNHIVSTSRKHERYFGKLDGPTRSRVSNGYLVGSPKFDLFCRLRSRSVLVLLLLSPIGRKTVGLSKVPVRYRSSAF